mmetsp:Transcript_113935/g.332937  ORF Transcript_113935/g.332937 Transcript_113935/m.332937 type:complete len:81 (-) Transcript_113935:40-282(-)
MRNSTEQRTSLANACKDTRNQFTPEDVLQARQGAGQPLPWHACENSSLRNDCVKVIMGTLIRVAAGLVPAYAYLGLPSQQ